MVTGAFCVVQPLATWRLRRTTVVKDLGFPLKFPLGSDLPATSVYLCSSCRMKQCTGRRCILGCWLR